jgi:Synergist-CTERM protein sorting domain-containing protein
MATPHVTGAVALLASGSSVTHTASKLKEVLLATANPNINPKAPASIPGVVIPPQGVPDTTVSKHGLIDVKKAMDALLNPSVRNSGSGGGCDAGLGFFVALAVLAVFAALRGQRH